MSLGKRIAKKTVSLGRRVARGLCPWGGGLLGDVSLGKRVAKETVCLVERVAKETVS